MRSREFQSVSCGFKGVLGWGRLQEFQGISMPFQMMGDLRGFKGFQEHPREFQRGVRGFQGCFRGFQ